MDGVPVPEGGVLDNGGFYSTPWALSEKFFLVSYTYGDKTTDPVGYGLYLVDVFGNKELIYRDPDISCFVPVPLRPRQTPPILPDVTDPAARLRHLRGQRRELRLRGSRAGADSLSAGCRADRLALRQPTRRRPALRRRPC